MCPLLFLDHRATLLGTSCMWFRVFFSLLFLFFKKNTHAFCLSMLGAKTFWPPRVSGVTLKDIFLLVHFLYLLLFFRLFCITCHRVLIKTALFLFLFVSRVYFIFSLTYVLAEERNGNVLCECY